MAQDIRKKLILAVEDQPDELSYLRTLFEDNGYGVVTAEDGEAALEAARREKPDLVTLDISMPRKSGVRFYRELKDDPELASIPVVIVTAVTGFGGDPEGFKKFIGTRRQVPPPEGFVAKPIDQQELLETVGSLLA